jgi:outer membrane receptor protein involved in Fe transport
VVDDIVRDWKFVSTINPETISRVDVLKGEKTAQFGEKGKNGVIRITSKTPDEIARVHERMALTEKSIALTLQIDASHRPREYDARFRVRGYAKQEPLWIVDGIIQPKGVSNSARLDPNMIESISVLKEKESVAKYGNEGQYGVIIITMKKTRQQVSPVKHGVEPVKHIDSIQLKP